MSTPRCIMTRLLLTLFIVGSSNSSQHQTATIVLTVNSGFRGTRTTVTLPPDTCVNIPSTVNDQVTSLDPNGHCIRLYEDIRCRGDSIDMDVASNDLTFESFNDRVSSIKLCDDPLTMGFRYSFKSHRMKYISLAHLILYYQIH